MKAVQGNIGYDYETIVITQSRLNKGLLAIPVSLIDWFPKEKTTINIFFDNEILPIKKGFTPYTSSSRECRIGGMGDWYSKHSVRNHDEIVIQFINPLEKTYRILTEKELIKEIHGIQYRLDNAKNDKDAENQIEKLSKKINSDKKVVAIHEFLRLQKSPVERRKIKIEKPKEKRQNIPGNIRAILEIVYEGHCQITDFTFIQRNKKPYFEVHHIKPEMGHHFKNLLVVSPNIHTQFTFANKKEYFDQDGWLRKVRFNNDEYKVSHAIDKLDKIEFEKTTHFTT